MKKQITCTVCPRGCTIEAEYTSREDIKLTGYGCNRGVEYSKNECFEPKRTFTSSVRIRGAYRRMLPVRTSAPVPKELLQQCAERVRALEVTAPVTMGQVLDDDFLGTGTQLIASMTLPKED